MLALLYLLCAMAPTIALALPGTLVRPACLSVEPSRTSRVHDLAMSGHTEHSHMHAHPLALDGHGDMTAAAADKQLLPARKSTGGSCCELMCLIALPATLADVARPLTTPLPCESEPSRVATDRAPPRLYRPPIS